jgi:hypothetical protein
MSHIPLDFGAPGKRSPGTPKPKESPVTHAPSHLTATQIGAIGEALVASQLLLASDGRLTPFQPIADDDGIDLLVFDKRTRCAASVQVKARIGSAARPSMRRPKPGFWPSCSTPVGPV